MKLKDKTYDVLKWIALIALPTIAAFYSGLAIIWGFPYGEEIVGTITLVEALIGGLIGVSTASYKKSNNTQK